MIPGDWDFEMLAGFGFQTRPEPCFYFLQIHYEFSKTFFDKEC
jgi:hypothetical protein